MKPDSRWVSLVIVCVFAGCAGCPMDPFGDGDSRLVILSYNCQNLFDDVDQGTEYPEYDPTSGTWNNETYLGKLAALAEAIRKAPREPDILLLQEVENRAVLERLSRDFLPLGRYDFSAAPEVPGAAVRTGIISRVPVENLRVHRPVGSETERNILEIDIKYGEERFVILNNHWKSRLGGAEATEPERIRSALLVRRRIEELHGAQPGVNIILAGDFNEDPWEEGRDYPAALGPADGGGFPPVLNVYQDQPEESTAPGSTLYSFWAEIKTGGSYFYGGVWERIDHFFWNRSLADGRGLDVTECALIDDPLLLNAYGTPLAYNAKNMSGYSDHLPLLIVLDGR